MTDTGRIVFAKLPSLTVLVRRRAQRPNGKPGTIAAYALAEEDRKGRNILARRRCRTLKRAKKKVELHLAAMFGAVPSIIWTGDINE